MISNTQTHRDPAIPYASVTALREAHTHLLKLSRSGDVQAFAEIDAFLHQAKATGALLDSEQDRALSQSLMDYWVTVLYRARRTPPDATLSEFDPLLAPSLPDEICPYVGLNAFEEKNNEAFFGRQPLLNQMVAFLKEDRLLYVVGPSGSGKSSLVLAGLVPLIKKGAVPGSEKWQCLRRIVPGVNPLKHLASTIAGNESGDAEWIERQAEEFETDPNHLRNLLSQTEVRSMLIIDQLEELFTLCPDENQRLAFVDNIVNATREPDAPCTIVLTIRTDFEPQLARYPELMKLIDRGTVRVTPLTAADLHDAIELPANRVGLRFEDGIVEQLVRDILGEAAGLPLLQFALLSLWKARERNRVTWSAFRKLGSARLALGRAADEFFSNLIVEDQRAAKGIFLRLVRPGELSHEFTSNRMRRESLYTTGVASDRIDRVLEKLIAVGLIKLTKGDVRLRDQVEVAHEALVRNWNTLVDWLEDERTRLRQRIRLTTAAEQWLEHGKDPGGLLRGVLLEEALKYTDRNEEEEEFVKASQAAVEQEQLEKEQAFEREQKLDRERSLALHQRAEENARHAVRTRRLALVLAVVAVCAIVFATSAAVKRKEAVAENKRATEQATLAKKASDVAESRRIDADNARKQAESSKSEAIAAKIEAEQNLEQARLAERKAVAAQRIAQQQSLEVRRLLLLTQKEKDRADVFAADVAQMNEKVQQEKDESDQRDELNRTATIILRKPKANEDELREAVKKLTQVRDLYKKYEKRMGEEDTVIALASAYRRLRDQNAQKYYDEAVKLLSDDIETASSSGSTRVVDAVKRLGDFYRSQAEYSRIEYSKAALLYTQELNKLEQKLIQAQTDNDLENDRMIENYTQYVKKLEEIYRDQNRFRDMEPVYQKSLEVKRKILKPDSYGVYVSLNDLGNFYRGQRKFADAEPYLREALTIAKALGPDNQREVVNSLRNLASLFRDQRKYDEAQVFYEDALKGLETTAKPENNKILADTLNDLATTYQELGKYAESERSYQQLIDRCLADPDQFPGRLNTARSNLAALYFEQGDLAKSEQLYQTVAENIEKENKTQELVPVLTALGNIKRILKKTDAAIQLYARILKVYDDAKVRPPAATNITLALLYDQKGEHDRAREFYWKTKDSWRVEDLVGYFITDRRDYEGIREILDMLNLAGKMFKQQIKYAEAERYYSEALEISRKLYGPNDANYLVYSLNNLADVYQLQNKNNQAEALYKQALTNLERDPRFPDPFRMADTLESYAKVLENTGRIGEAAKLKARARAIRPRRSVIDG